MTHRDFQLEACYHRVHRLYTHTPSIRIKAFKQYVDLIKKQLGPYWEFMNTTDDKRSLKQLEHDSEPAWTELTNLLEVQRVIDS